MTPDTAHLTRRDTPPPERFGRLAVTGGEFHMEAELKIVAAKRKYVTVEFQGKLTEVRVGQTLTLNLTGTVERPS